MYCALIEPVTNGNKKCQCLDTRCKKALKLTLRIQRLDGLIFVDTGQHKLVHDDHSGALVSLSFFLLFDLADLLIRLLDLSHLGPGSETPCCLPDRDKIPLNQESALLLTVVEDEVRGDFTLLVRLLPAPVEPAPHKRLNHQDVGDFDPLADRGRFLLGRTSRFRRNHWVFGNRLISRGRLGYRRNLRLVILLLPLEVAARHAHCFLLFVDKRLISPLNEGWRLLSVRIAVLTLKVLNLAHVDRSLAAHGVRLARHARLHLRNLCMV